MTKPIDKVYIKSGSRKYHRTKSYGFRNWQNYTACGSVSLSECVGLPEASAVAGDFEACGRCWPTTARNRAKDIRRALLDRGVVA